MDKSTILSVGIDIGTSTTQVIFSRLTFENTAGYFAVPKVSIVDKEVVYKSDIFTTPLRTQTMIDGEAVRSIVAGEFLKAGYTPKDTDTGAVIITGESARKENSAIVLENLSDFAGEFVVSTAGPDLEAIVAGKGSGARQYSEDCQCVVVNLDIGGGTTNVVMFDCGEVVAKGCVDIGGRLVKIGPDGRITYVSDSAKACGEAADTPIKAGEHADRDRLLAVTDTMAETLERLLGIRMRNRLLESVKTPGSSEFILKKPIEAVCFSGGVADCIYNVHKDSFRFGDIGVLLGESIRSSRLFKEFKVVEPLETIRATVVGAGSYTTSVSGSTISYSSDMFPFKNLPVLKLTQDEQAECFKGNVPLLRDKISWFLDQSDSEYLILALKGAANPGYGELKTLARCISESMDAALPGRAPVIVIVEYDMAKALGQAVESHIGSKRDVICIDSIQVEQNDYVDMGKPLLDGMVIPVVVKTLIFG